VHRAITAALEPFPTRLDEALGRFPSPGLNAAALVGDEVVWQYATGVARFGPRAALTAAHLHRIGSITKLFTAHAVMILHDRGRIDIDTPVSAYLPWFRPAGHRVTIRHVLCHGSGIAAEGGTDAWGSGEFPDDAAFRALFATLEPAIPPMCQVKYSNAAYSMLGYLIEAASGVPYEAFVQAEILDRLGMRETAFHLSDAQRAVFAQGHFMPPFERRFAPTPHQELRSFTACGMLASTPRDLLRFARQHWSPAADALVRPDTRDEMRRVQLMDTSTPGWHSAFGLGWRLVRRGERVFVGHGGSYLGNSCALELDPDREVAVALFANRGGVEGLVDLALALTEELADAAGAAMEPPVPDDTPPPAALRPFLGTYAMDGWFTAVVTFARGTLWLQMQGGPPVPLEPLTEGRLRITRDRNRGEDVVAEAHGEDGRVATIRVAGGRMHRI